MPFINGRYHVNPAMGQALEAARQAESALLALQQQASRNSAADDGATANSPDASAPAKSDALIHHIEIDATELVPTSSGRAVRGFVARVHRAPDAPSASSAGQGPAPETHTFVDHRDLVNFLRDSLASS
jgi:hypothetical protein